MKQRIIYEIVGGSKILGLDTPESDEDRMGIYLEPPESMIGFHRVESVEVRPQNDGERSQPGDVETTMYSLRKFCMLALKGNPTIIAMLYAPDQFIVRDSEIAQELRAMADKFASLRVPRAFLGYLKHQKQRLTGERGQKRVKRLELVERHGYDTKYPMHCLRLAYQGFEYIYQASLRLPMPSLLRTELAAVRNGQMSLDEVVQKIDTITLEIEDAMNSNPRDLPSSPCTNLVEAWMIRKYLEGWKL